MTRKEVEDLIANKQTIYVLSKNALCKKSITAFDTNLYEFRNFNDFGFELVDIHPCSKQILWVNYSQVKTRQEAEWFEEFGNITRTETLNLLTWEEFQKEGYCKFNSKDGRNLVIEYSVIFDFDSKNHKDYINILDTKDYDHNRIFVSDYTKDGYTLACRKAKELFLGEKENGNEE